MSKKRKLAGLHFYPEIMKNLITVGFLLIIGFIIFTAFFILVLHFYFKNAWPGL
jgi:hypothetical protein